MHFRESGSYLGGSAKTRAKYYLSNLNAKDKKLYKHPTIKPIELLDKYIINSSKEGDIVLDCFMGSGSTAVSCIKNKRQFIGCEIEKKWFDIANDRINEAKYLYNQDRTVTVKQQYLF